MANPLPPNSSSQPSEEKPSEEKLSEEKSNPSTPPTPLRCFTGAIISGGFATLLYSFTQSIIQVFANKPVPTGNPATTNIAVAVRTLVVGMSTLATAIFAISAVGVAALGIQLMVKQFRQPAD
ncbi:MAG TPA: DUF3082 domain-containing protein [Coleofasciculaceae cyanobacterium]